MAPPQKGAKAPQDAYAAQAKTLSSAVRRLRGWVSSDDSRTPELADALLALNRHRLLGHAYAAAAPDAQEAFRLAGQLLTANGPLGPYTSVEDALRYATAVVQLALVQSGVGLAEAAGRAVASLDELADQLQELALPGGVDPLTSVWALLVSGRTHLAAGDPGRGNAYADAALTRLPAARQAAEPDDAFVALDVQQLASDARWAAGRADEALALLHTAKDLYDGVVADRFAQPARLSAALAERLAEPAPGLYRDLADRLVGRGELELALVTRRHLVDLLRSLRTRLGPSGADLLASALTDLAQDLQTAGRPDEADAAAAEAAALGVVAVVDAAAGLARRRPEPATTVAWSPVTAADSFSAATAVADGPTAVSAGAESGRSGADWLDAERAEARRHEQARLAQAQHEAEEQAAREAAARRAADEERAAAAQAEQAEARRQAERQAAAEEAERLETKRRREERLEEHRREVERQQAERLAAERLEVEQRVAAEPDELEEARRVLADARGKNDRRAVRAALESLTDLLRPRAQANLPAYGPELQAALEELSSARLRGGDVWGSRAPAREAKALGRLLGR